MASSKTRKPAYWQQAARELSKADAKLRPIIRAYRGETLVSKSSAYETLLRAIVGQQISVKAADSVWRKLLAAIEGPHPEILASASQEQLRACGLSRQKIAYIYDLSEFFREHRDPRYWQKLDDEAAIKELTQIKGIGRWTAEMFLIFHLLRPDVLPMKDIGLQKAINLHYRGQRDLTLKQMEKLAETWRPWRSVATWYLWRSLDPVPVAY